MIWLREGTVSRPFQAGEIALLFTLLVSTIGVLTIVDILHCIFVYTDKWRFA